MDIIKKYVDLFNGNDEELYVNSIDNGKVYEWLCEEIPIFECPDKDIEQAYYFRWWTYRKHIRETEKGYMITEFLPKVPWSGEYNEINAAVGHHIYEGRWLKNGDKYLKDYIYFFLNNPQRGHQYSAWLIYSVYQMCTVTGKWDLGDDFLEKICAYYDEWEKTHLLSNGMFWSNDDRDAMEYSISGTTEDFRRLKGIRPTLNSYMCADSWAISDFARRVGNEYIENKYLEKHKALKNAINENLWQNNFYRAFHFEDGQENKACEQMVEGWKEKTPRELIGYIPWMFNIPEKGREFVFDYLTDKNCFNSTYGLTTADMSDRRFLYYNEHECLWNGYVWPFATSQTLTAMRNVIMNYNGEKKYRNCFFELLKQYAKSHMRKREDGFIIPWIDEVRHPLKDEWSSREILKGWGWLKEKGGYERGKDYNHSTFCDIVISGLVGVRYENDTIDVLPSIPDSWEYFKLDNLKIRDKVYTILYDKSGEKYKKGKGIKVFAK